ncbi:anti-sigma factor family protein [Streptacidiphilus anmyonensis]|uniref:anti-sigma factor family protein n=1 Tax=Streptacidiphilus anmyonensis TaxID=405782 RepID=UPI000693B825|nr:zf-HC2 domain-containing protein [Streptacidiphilus anmyonensis]
MSEQSRRVPRSEIGELRVTQVSVAVTAPPPQEHHLGDRLAAFVDGELDHGARERVQAHLATCPDCLAEAEAERRLKAHLREVLCPEPSGVFLSRLMAISAADDDEGEGRPPQGTPSRVRSLFGGSGAQGPGAGFGMSGGLGNGGLRGSSFGNGALGADRPVPGIDPRARRERGREPRGERPIAARLRAGSDSSGSTMSTSGAGSAQAERAERAAVVGVAPSAPAAPRGRRLVFAAAGAFSVAAVTLSSALTGVTATSEAPHDVAPLSGSNNYAPSANYAPNDGQPAYNVARVDDAPEHPAVNQHVALARPGTPPILYPAAQLR